MSWHATTRHRWGLDEGGEVGYLDVGDAIVMSREVSIASEHCSTPIVDELDASSGRAANGAERTQLLGRLLRNEDTPSPDSEV